MARDKKASFKFTAVTGATAPQMNQGSVTTDKLGATITITASSVAYRGASDVFSTPNMVLAAAADFASQADTAASGSSDLNGTNGQTMELFAKVVYTMGGTLTNIGSPTWKVVGSAASTVSAGALSSSPADISAAAPLQTSAGTYVVYLPVLSSKPYWQLQLTGTASGAASGATVQVVMAALVNGRDGSVGL
jgi:hypothetical protein